MTPPISPPAPEVLAELLAKHAQRFPEKFQIRVPGPDGVNVVLPILLGIPSGAVRVDEKIPEADRPKFSPAWSAAVAVPLGFGPDSDRVGEQLVRDCILWPPPATWNLWREEWPALDQPAMRLVRKKIARGEDCFEQPDKDVPIPEGLKVSARGVWRILKPAPDIVHYVAVEPPSQDAWRLYLRLSRETGADIAKTTRDIVDFCTGNKIPEVLDRWPGFVPSLGQTIAYLAGAGAEGELGNW